MSGPVDPGELGALVMQRIVKQIEEGGELDPDDLVVIGVLLLGIGCAKKGETLVESVDHHRRYAERGERALRMTWDHLRRLSTGRMGAKHANAKP